MEPIAITGLGVASPIGIGYPAWREALRDHTAAQRRAFGRVSTVLDPEKVGHAKAAEVWDFDASAFLGAKGLRNFDRLTKHMIVAAKLALEHGGVKKDGEFISLDPGRAGICSSTAYGSLDAITELNLVAELEDPRYINPARFPNTVVNAAAGYVSIWENLRAPNVTIVDGNCGALDAVLSCETHLAHRRADLFLVGGAEVLSEALYLAFRKLGALADDGTRGGLCLGEGAAYLCAERLDHAAGRGAPVLALVAGYGTAFEPPSNRAILVHASPQSVRRAIEEALLDAGVSASDVDAVCSSVGGLDEMDSAELSGIGQVLGDRVPVAAPKRIYGECFGAWGAMGMASAVAWFDGAPVGPMVKGEPPRELRTVVVTAVGFYGNVSAVVMRKSS